MRSLAALFVFAFAGCGGGTAQSGVYLTASGNGSAGVEGSLTPGSARLKPSVCQGERMSPDFGRRDESDLVLFLKAHGYETRTVRARPDLVYVDVTNIADQPVRLRVAILPSTPEAGRDLHDALLQHGPGSWGVHRSNLAVLAPIGDTDQIIDFAIKTKLACWGVLTMAGRDDTFVIPGGYTEL